MPRPSQNIDHALIDAGLRLLPETGCKGLSVRRLVQEAGVNLGMFHYHFENKENFIRQLLQRVYEEMFSALTLEVQPQRAVMENLQHALRVLVHFGRRHRALLGRIAADALAGEALAIGFLRANVPRHAQVMAGLVAQAQQQGMLAAAPLPELIVFLFSSVGLPVLLGGVVQQQAGDPQIAALIDQVVLSDAAIDRRIEFALRGIAAEGRFT